MRHRQPVQHPTWTITWATLVVAALCAVAGCELSPASPTPIDPSRKRVLCDARLFQCSFTDPASQPGGAFGVTVAMGRLIAGAEIRADPLASTRVLETLDFRAPVERVFEHRASVLSLLVGYYLVQRKNVALSIEARPAIVMATTAVTEFGVRDTPAFSEYSTTEVGVTFGATLVTPIARRLAIVVPARLTASNRGTASVGTANFTAAAGLLVTVSRGAR